MARETVKSICAVFSCQKAYSGKNKYCSKECLRLSRQGARLVSIPTETRIISSATATPIALAVIVDYKYLEEKHVRHITNTLGIPAGEVPEHIIELIQSIAKKHRYKDLNSYVLHIQELLRLNAE